jgi:hypothetical protein
MQQAMKNAKYVNVLHIPLFPYASRPGLAQLIGPGKSSHVIYAAGRRVTMSDVCLSAFAKSRVQK